MTSTRARAGLLARAVLVLSALFAASVLVPVVAAPPAFAGGGGSVDDGGPGNNNGAGGNANTGLGSGTCRGGQLWYGNQKASDGPYHGCIGLRTYGSTTSFTPVLCTTGFEVYRFYGTVANPTAAVVRSQLNTATACGNEARYRFATVSPYDSGALGSPQATSTARGGLAPWHARRLPNNPDTSAIAAYEAPGALWYTTPVWRWLADDGYPVGKLDDGITVAQVQGNCKNVQSVNSYAKDLADPTVDEASKQLIRALLWKMYDQLTQTGSVTYALSELGMSSFTRNGHPVDHSPLRTNAEGTYSDVFTIAWDTLACSSPFDYVSSSLNPNSGSNTVTGVCYIPTMRSARQYPVWNGREVVRFNDWSSMTSPWADMVGGLRYSAFYAGTAGTAGQEQVGYSGLSQATANAIGGAWRNAMTADYYRRLSGGLYDTAGGHQTQNAPGQPYVNEFSGRFSAQPWNVAAAAATLHNDAHCAFGDHVAWQQLDQNPNTTPPPVSEKVTVKAPAAFQVGGMLRVQQVTATAGPLLCNGGPCGSADRLNMLHYRLDVQGLNGYRKCGVGQTFGCDFAVLTPPRVLTGPKDIQQTQTMTLIFYNPTMPTQDVRVTLNDLAANFAHDWSMTSPRGTVTAEDGTPVSVGGDVIHGTRIVLFNPTVVGAPKTVPVIGASAVPGD